MTEEEFKALSKEEQQRTFAKNASAFFEVGDYRRGWAAYSYRELIFYGPAGRAEFKMPRWQGQDLKGKTLALCYEQALGEQIMFASLIPDLLKEGCNLVVETDKRLISILHRTFPGDRVKAVPVGYPSDPDLLMSDYFCLMGNPAMYYRKTVFDFERAPVRYLQPKYVPAHVYRTKNVKKVVGLSWYSPAVYQGDDKNVDVSYLEPILRDQSLSCIGLQYGNPKVWPMQASRPRGVDLTNDIDGVFSLVDSCSHIVTISNTVAHIAGSLGKTTYLLLKPGNAYHWYWKMPFYPSVKRILLQEKGEYEKKFAEIHKNIVDSYL